MKYANVTNRLENKFQFEEGHVTYDSSMGSTTSVTAPSIECTTNRYQISYARILVEIDITKEIIHEITIRDKNEERMQQLVEYEGDLRTIPNSIKSVTYAKKNNRNRL